MRLLLLTSILLVLAGASASRAGGGMPAYNALLADCVASSDAACPGQQAALEPQWPKALSGDIFSLRNFAFCLADGCYGAFKRDPVRACALRIVIAAIGDRPIPAEDRDNFDRDCSPLAPDDQDSAKFMARDLVRSIRQKAP